MKRLLFVLTVLLSTQYAHAQCGAGELEFTLYIETDFWGYEGYWEIIPAGNGCGNGTIISGGNFEEVGCFGGGMMNASGFVGYPDEAMIEVGPFCLEFGVSYQLVYVDDFGDGGFSFTLLQEQEVFFFVSGSGTGNVWTFTPGFSPIPDYALPCNAFEVGTDGVSVVLNNSFAYSTFDEITPPAFDCEVYGFWCEDSADQTVWAKAIIPDNGSYRISACGPQTNFDTQMAVYLASDCGDYSTYTLISANDDMPAGCIYQPFASECYITCLPPGTEIMIQIDGYFGESGVVELRVEPNEFPAYADVVVWGGWCPPTKGEPAENYVFPLIYGWGIDYTIQWTGPNNFTSNEPFLSFLADGEYQFVATNACGDQLSSIAYIEAGAPFTPFYQVTPASCPLASNGSIVFSLLGGSGPYEAFWFGPNGEFFEGMNPTGMAPGFYEVFAMDANGCGFFDFVQVGAGTGVVVNLGPTQTICLDESVSLTGPMGMANYTWTNGVSTSSQTLTGQQLGVGSHDIGLSVTDTFGCTGSGSVTIVVDNCVGIDEINSAELVIFPNPVVDVLRMSGFRTDNLLYEVLDIGGRTVMAGRMRGNETEAMRMESGLYFLRLFTDNQTVVLPFVKL